MEALYNGGVFGRDGCIYSFNHVRKKLLKVNNTYSLVGNEDICRFYGNWGNAILGNDGCIYWPPRNVNRTMKFDPETQATINTAVGEIISGVGALIAVITGVLAKDPD